MSPDRESPSLDPNGGSPSIATGPEPDVDALAKPPLELVPATETSASAAAAPDVDDEADPAETLSPAVRRLVREYDLDITGIHGSGPSGRIRVGDVIPLLGGRGEIPKPAKSSTSANDPAENVETSAAAAATPATAVASVPITTVFECDLGRVLAHRTRRREENAEASLTSYCVVACGEALQLVPETARVPAGADCPLFGVLLGAPEGLAAAIVAVATDSAAASLDERLRAADLALRSAAAGQDLGRASLLVHHHGLGGSIIATPTPIGPRHAASLGIGRVRRQIVVRTIDGTAAPKAAALCYVSLTFDADALELHRANAFLARLVHVLEHWPD